MPGLEYNPNPKAHQNANIKVLIVITTAFVPYGGLTTVMINYLEQMDRTGLIIDVVSGNNIQTEMKKKIEGLGIRYFKIEGRRKSPLKYYLRIKRMAESYDVIHVNGNSSTASLELLAAKKAGVCKRIAHNHSSSCSHKYIHLLLLPLFRRLYTKAVACSDQAGKFAFGNKRYTILKNAISVERYSYSEEKRRVIRRVYAVPETAFVVGHVGKMNHDKNQRFLVDVFGELTKKVDNVFLMLVGDGKLRAEIEKQIDDLHLRKRVVLTGMQSDASSFYSAMDIFVFPSLHEGMGMVCVEAQASGLSVIASEEVPNEADCTPLFFKMDLDEGRKAWANKLYDYMNNNRCICRSKTYEFGDYDIRLSTNLLRKLWE